jgi:hypothetical protein
MARGVKLFDERSLLNDECKGISVELEGRDKSEATSHKDQVTCGKYQGADAVTIGQQPEASSQ